MKTDWLRELLSLYESKQLSRSGLEHLMHLSKNLESTSHNNKRVAVIGVGGYFGQAKNIFAFWEQLARKSNFVIDFPECRAKQIETILRSIDDSNRVGSKSYWKASFIDEVSKFDNQFFGISEAEALIMDPQQRLFLEVSYQTFENAGYTRKMLDGKEVGVFLGEAENEYRYILPEVTPFAVAGNISPFISAKVSQFFNLHGSVLNVGSTCSSSLSALNVGVSAIQSNECTMALVGASNLRLFPFNVKDDPVKALGILSPKEECTPFDDNADGITRGEGVCALLLKDYEAAKKDRDYIYAVVEASGTNNDGTPVNIGAPKSLTQTKLLKHVWGNAGLSDISQLKYIEAHGTGTKLGDPIEVEAINKAVSSLSDNKQFIGLGSIKSNLGHLTGGGAGLAGILKAIVGLDRNMIPATINFQSPNKHINFAKSATYIVKDNLFLPSEQVNYVGISSFGFNGANAHVVLSNYEYASPSHSSEYKYDDLVFAFSAPSESRLEALLGEHLNCIRSGIYQPYSLLDISYTLLCRRETFENKVVFVCSDLASLGALIQKYLNTPSSKRVISIRTPTPSVERTINDWLNSNSIDLSGFDSCVSVPLATMPMLGESFWYDADYHQLFSSSAPAKQLSKNQVNECSIGNLRSCWEEVLGHNHFSNNMNFSSVGGDSILAIQLLSRIKYRFKKDINLNTFYNHQTVNKLIQIIFSNSESIPKPVNTNYACKNAVSRAQNGQLIIRFKDKTINSYNMPEGFIWHGQLDLPRLENAINQIIWTYEIMRTTFHFKEGQFVASIHRYEDIVPFSIVDFSRHGHSRFTQEEALSAFSEMTQVAFDFEKLYLFKCVFIPLENDKYFLGFVIDHLISDGWSLHLFMQLVIKHYRLGSATDGAINKLSHQFQDTILLERNIEKTNKYLKAERYWNEYLADYTYSLIPGDKARPEIFTYQGKDLVKQLSIQATKKIHDFITQHQVSRVALFQAVAQVLIYAYTGLKDITLGSVSSGRFDDIHFKQLGCFSNLFVLRRCCVDEETLISLCLHNTRDVNTALDYQFYPFDKLVDALWNKKDLSKHPLFAINVAVHDFVNLGSNLKQHNCDNFELSHYRIPSHSSKWDLQFELTTHDNTITFRLEYYKDIFTGSFANVLADNYINLLDYLIDNPDQEIDKVNLDGLTLTHSEPISFEWGS